MVAFSVILFPPLLIAFLLVMERVEEPLRRPAGPREVAEFERQETRRSDEQARLLQREELIAARAAMVAEQSGDEVEAPAVEEQDAPVLVAMTMPSEEADAPEVEAPVRETPRAETPRAETPRETPQPERTEPAPAGSGLLGPDVLAEVERLLGIRA